MQAFMALLGGLIQTAVQDSSPAQPASTPTAAVAEGGAAPPATEPAGASGKPAAETEGDHRMEGAECGDLITMLAGKGVEIGDELRESVGQWLVARGKAASRVSPYQGTADTELEVGIVDAYVMVTGLLGVVPRS